MIIQEIRKIRGYSEIINVTENSQMIEMPRISLWID